MLAFIPTLSTLLVTCTVAILSGAQPAFAQETPPVVEEKKDSIDDAFWAITPPEAFVEAAKQNKLSILIFLNPGEDTSDRMLNEALSDPVILKWLKTHSIAVKQLAGVHPGWIKRKGIRNFPTISIRTANRQIVDILHGYRTTGEWLVLLENAKRTASANTKPEGDAAEDPYSWLAYGSFLFGSAGDPDEIGNAFLWCLDHATEKDPEFLEKHLNFILRKLVQVAKITPNVKQGIYLRRNALHNKVITGESTAFEAYALSLFGMYLRDMDDAIRAFNQIKPDSKHKAQIKSILMWNNLERMVAFRRYADILEHLPDPQHAMERRMAAIVAIETGKDAQQTSDLPRPPGAQGAGTEEGSDKAPKIQPETPLPGVLHTRSDMIVDASLLYECLLAIGKLEQAHNLMVKVTDFEPTGRCYAVFVERSNRLQLMELSHSVADRGAERVPEDEIWRIRNQVIRGTRGVKK